MDGECGAQERDENCIHSIRLTSEVKRSLGRPRRRLEIDNTVYLKEK